MRRFGGLSRRCVRIASGGAALLLLHACDALRFGFIEEEQKLVGRPFVVVHFWSPVPVA